MQQPEHYGVKKKNMVLPSDVEKVRLDVFDESDPVQHCQKIMVGCGIYFGFRGRSEHACLRHCDAQRGFYETGHAYEGKRFVGIGQLKDDKKHNVSTHNNYVRDTEDIMRMPVLDEDDPNDFASSFLRYLDRLDDHQERMYCYVDPKKIGTAKPYFAKKPLGKDKIHALQLNSAERMGLDMKYFLGGHAWRHFMVQGMVNDPTVPLQESMKASRHTSISAHMGYTSSDRVSEGRKISALLRRNNAVVQEEEKPAMSVTCKTDYKPVEVFREPENTQDEFAIFKEECGLVESSDPWEDAMLQVEPDFDAFMLEPCPPVSQKSVDTSPTTSQRAVETARASYDALLLQNKDLSSANVRKRQQVQNPYAKKQKVINPYLKKSSSRVLTPVNSNKIHNPYRVTLKQSTMSREQAEIRRLRMEMRKLRKEACERDAEYRRKSREEAREREAEHRRDIDDYRQRLCDMQQTYEFNHNAGNWSHYQGGNHHHNKNHYY